MKTILIPTDFSETAKEAFKYGVRLAQRIGASVKVVHIIQENLTDLSADNYVLTDRSIIWKALTAFSTIEKVSRWGVLPDVETQSYECKGEIGDKIIELSKCSDIDIVVMGSTGEGHVLDKWFGTTASYVAQNAFCPVLLVPLGKAYRNPKRLLFAHNLDQPTQTATLERIAFIAKCFEAKVHNLFVNTHSAQDAEIEELVKREWRMFETERFAFKTVMVKNKSILDTIQRYAVAHHIDLVLISTFHRPFLQQVFRESLTKQIALTAKVPILILHSEDKFSLF
jgi:nucleotide-binding universal stress UspA family protein